MVVASLSVTVTAEDFSRVSPISFSLLAAPPWFGHIGACPTTAAAAAPATAITTTPKTTKIITKPLAADISLVCFPDGVMSRYLFSGKVCSFFCLSEKNDTCKRTPRLRLLWFYSLQRQGAVLQVNSTASILRIKLPFFVKVSEGRS